MSLPTDHLPVPTNGKGPHPAPQALPASPGTPAAPEPALAPVTSTFAPTPTQLAVGFGILASLLLLIGGRLRRRRSRSGGLFGRG